MDVTLTATEPNQNLRDAIYDAGYELFDRCGGVGACYGCAVLVKQADACSEATIMEASAIGLAEGERLSCQTTFTGNITIELHEPS